MGAPRVRALALIVALGLLPAARPALALTWDPPDCRRGSPALAEAEAVEQRILRGLDDPDARLRPLVEALFAHRCLREPRRLFTEPLPTREAAVRAWLERGGHEWLRSTLKRRPEIVMIGFPPSFRPWIDATTIGPDDPLSPFVCPPADEACAAPAAGWLHRAHHEARIEARSRRWPQGCASERRVADWALCLLEQGRRSEVRVLPDGHLGPPRDGRLVWTRSGSWPELWVLELATARAARARLEPSARGARGHRAWVVETGRVALANLQEAALLLALHTRTATVRHAIRQDVYFYGPRDAPLDLPAALDALPPLERGGSGLAGSSSGTVAWSFEPASGPTGGPGLGAEAALGPGGAWPKGDSLLLEVTRRGFLREARHRLGDDPRARLDPLAGAGRTGHAAVRAILGPLLDAPPPGALRRSAPAQPGEH